MTIREKFEAVSGGDLCYYPLLYKALEDSKGDVLEMGMGHGSTPILNELITEEKRRLFSFDYNSDWLHKFDSILNVWHRSELVQNWQSVYNRYPDAAVTFIDQSPGEERKHTIVAYKDTKGILVIHDTEPTGAGDYQVRQHFPLFKYKAEVETAGAWATALSNEYDLTKWRGTFGNYTIS